MTPMASIPLLALALGLALAVGTAEVAALHGRAQTAADAAALAAVGAAPLVGGDGEGCRAAAAAARANGARLVACTGPGDGWAPRAEVAVTVGSGNLAGVLPALRARAAGVLEPARRP